jgi:hypothetical protein
MASSTALIVTSQGTSGFLLVLALLIKVTVPSPNPLEGVTTISQLAFTTAFQIGLKLQNTAKSQIKPSLKIHFIRIVIYSIIPIVLTILILGQIGLLLQLPD